MRKTTTAVLVLCALAATANGCDLINKMKGDDKADTGAASTATPTSTAKEEPKKEEPKEEPKKEEPKKTADFVNESDIQRYKDEKKFADPAAETLKQDVDVKEMAGEGPTITTLIKGTEVKQLSERQNFMLISFTDEAEKDKKMIGWVAKDGFKEAEKDAGVERKKVNCPLKFATVYGATQDYCVHKCEEDSDCEKETDVCRGVAHLSVNNKPSNTVIEFCVPGKRVVTVPDAGTTKPDAAATPDASATPDAAPATTDAGTTTPDAGGGSPLKLLSPTTRPINVPGQPPACIPQYKLDTEKNLCRLGCSSDNDCKDPSKCRADKKWCQNPNGQ